MTDATDRDARISTFTNDGFIFDVIDAGPIDGEVVVLLHGFPQSNRSWDKVTPLLHAAGYRTQCPNQRGYSPGARPTARRAYGIDRLVDDIVALADAGGAARVHVVGHDWGAGVAWRIASTHSTRVATLTTLSVPHPAAMQQAMLHSRQLLRSWYMVAMQIPWLPEKAIGSAGGTRLAEGLVKDGLGTEAAAHTAALAADPLTCRTMINWYRGLPFADRHRGGPVTAPTTYIWSDGDHYLDRWGAEHTGDHVEGPYTFVEIPGGTHWLPDTHPAEVAEAIIARAASRPATTEGDAA